jgi:phospholipid-binding lipoprotein MlaA
MLVVLPAGCATPPPVTEREAYQEYVETNDPFEPTNRAIFQFNRALDEGLFQPIARAYRSAVPLWLRQRVGDALENLSAPVVFLNDVLQGEAERAMTTLVRFVINSSIGVAGLTDMAGEMGLKGHDEDFGQTLAVWGAEDGPYIMLPIFGPSNPRDTVGRVVDWVVDPFNRWANNTDREELVLVRGGVAALHTRTELLDLTDDLEKTSLDLYAAVRSLYRQRRANAISNGVESNKVPEISSTAFPSLNGN